MKDTGWLHKISDGLRSSQDEPEDEQAHGEATVGAVEEAVEIKEEEDEDTPDPVEPGAIGSYVYVKIGAQEHEAVVVGHTTAIIVELRDGVGTMATIPERDWRPKPEE